MQVSPNSETNYVIKYNVCIQETEGRTTFMPVQNWLSTGLNINLRYKMNPNSSDSLQTSTEARGKLKVVGKDGEKVAFRTGEENWLDGVRKPHCTCAKHSRLIPGISRALTF